MRLSASTICCLASVSCRIDVIVATHPARVEGDDVAAADQEIIVVMVPGECMQRQDHVVPCLVEASMGEDLLAPIYERFEEGFDTTDLKEAKALLDSLPAPPGSNEEVDHETL